MDSRTQARRVPVGRGGGPLRPLRRSAVAGPAGAGLLPRRCGQGTGGAPTWRSQPPRVRSAADHGPIPRHLPGQSGGRATGSGRLPVRPVGGGGPVLREARPRAGQDTLRAHVGDPRPLPPAGMRRGRRRPGGVGRRAVLDHRGGPVAVFADAVVWLRERNVLLPGVTTLARLVAQVRDESTQRLWDTLSGNGIPPPGRRQRFHQIPSGSGGPGSQTTTTFHAG